MLRPAALLSRVALASALLCSGACHAFDWSDTYVSYRYIPNESAFEADAGGRKVDVAKNIIALTHVSGYKYGSNFFNLDILKSDSNNPAANGTPFPARGSNSGAQEVFAIYRHDLSLSAVSGSSMKFGPIKDITLTAGFNAGSKNDFNGASPRAWLLGPTLQFALPAGFLNVGVQAYKESNNSNVANAFTHDGAHQNFKTAAQWNLVWGIPFNAGLPANFKGFLSYTGSKGKGSPHGDETKGETLMDALLMFDVGSTAGKKDVWWAGGGFRYWNNKFGNDEGLGPNNRAGHISSGMVQLEAHF
jgi:nucleoside-specific outer membrane channel protein Tsx